MGGGCFRSEPTNGGHWHPSVTHPDPDLSSPLVPAELAAEPVHKVPIPQPVKIFMWITYIGTVIFMWGLPKWSKIFNDGWGRISPQWETQCWTPAEEVLCGGGQDYMEIAKTLNRKRDGKYYGCSCGEGAFGDWVCPVSTKLLAGGETYTNSFSISYFISTAPGTGTMAAFTAWPILAMWYFGCGHPEFLEIYVGLKKKEPYEEHYRMCLQVSLVLFQITYGLFLMNTVCVDPLFHSVSVVLFNGSMVFHYIATSCHVGLDHSVSWIIQLMCWSAVLAIVSGTIYSLVHPGSPTFLGQYAFWMSECFGLTMGFGITPVLTLFLRPCELALVE